MSRLAALALAIVVLSTASATPARPRPTLCTGRFAIAAGDVDLLGDGSPAAARLDIDAGGRVTLDACGSTTARLKAKRHATLVNARWAACHAAVRVVLTARIPSPACNAVSGTLKRKGAKRVRFTATSIACDDGRLDAGEICDASAPGGDAACPGACTSCACVVSTTVTTTSSTTSTSTSSTTSTSTSTTTLPPDGPPVTAPLGTWTWVDVPDSLCDDGSPTGFGINLADSPNVVMMLAFGGACWDANTCWVQNTALHGPIGQAQWDAIVAAAPGGDILDRTLPGNPFATWNLVALPYCTGDLHAGDNVVTYDTGTTLHVHHHVGHANLLAFLRRLGPTFPSPGKVVLGGMSSGGFGAFLDYPTIRARWPNAQGYVMADSGPLLESASFDSAFIASWFTNWRLDKVTDPVCDGPCRTDLSLFVPALAARFPNDRMALVSTTQDSVIADLFGLSGPDFQTALLAMATDRFDPTANVRYFFDTGTEHAQTVDPANVAQNGTYLLDWIGQLVGDDPAWTSVKP